MCGRAIFTSNNFFFPRNYLNHSQNQSGPKWPHLSIFSLKFLANSRSGPPRAGYFGSKFSGAQEMCFYWKIFSFYMMLVHFFFKFIRKTWANQFSGCKSSLGSLRGDKTRKTIKNQRFLINFCSFFPFCRPGVSSKYSYAPESVCPRFSDEFLKKMDQHHVQTEDFPIKAHFLGAQKFEPK